MENGKQPINPTTYTRVGDGDNDFDPLVDGHITGYEKKFGGLTKREYFAGLCIQGILSAQTEMRSNGQQNNYFGAAVESIVSEALEITDELLKQLE